MLLTHAWFCLDQKAARTHQTAGNRLKGREDLSFGRPELPANNCKQTYGPLKVVVFVCQARPLWKDFIVNGKKILSERADLKIFVYQNLTSLKQHEGE